MLVESVTFMKQQQEKKISVFIEMMFQEKGFCGDDVRQQINLQLIQKDLVFDPSLPHHYSINKPEFWCPKCSHTESVEVHDRGSDSMMVFLLCCNEECQHIWSKYPKFSDTKSETELEEFMDDDLFQGK